MIISKIFRFEASHVLPKHSGACQRIHGHSWILTVSVEGYINPSTGFVVDFLELKGLVNKEIIDKLDHQHLGFGSVHHSPYLEASMSPIQKFKEAIPPFGLTFYPSSENLVNKFLEILTPLIPKLGNGISLYEISLEETCTSKAIWRAKSV